MITTQTYIIDVIEGRRKGVFVKGALRVMSGVFELGVKLRNFAFDRQWIKEKKVAVPVISIGNIIAGGTGKTAFIQRLAKDLRSMGKVSILSRGYRSEIEKIGGSLHLIEQSRITPEVCGDEAYLLFKSLPDAVLFVGKDRVLNAERAVYHDADVILLDDGMQYRSLHRDLEIVMLHGDDLYGRGFFLPRGYLRDSPKRLESADAIIVNHIQDLNHFHEMEKEINAWTKAPIIGTRMVPEEIKMASGEKLRDLKDRRVAAFCGLGKPDSFFKTLSEMGGDIAQKWVLPDHVGPKKEALTLFAERSAERGCDIIVCSEKDWVKLPIGLDLPLPIGYLKAELQVVTGKERYEKLLEKIQSILPRKELG
ncbi:MAG: tetraacyldisaccharide 4'-kinase [Chlamydiales bacterium]|nr:tetraacyldisaccharide 4'-kinase [Chlamydiia bacterium]MCP5504939.1 tetraacyldisaccharide 4'-kinase [Chlamydiales bacterium]